MKNFEVYLSYTSSIRAVCSSLPAAEVEERLNTVQPLSGERWVLDLWTVERGPATTPDKPGPILYEGPTRCERLETHRHYWFRRTPA